MTRIKLNGVVGEIDSLPGCGQVAVSHSVFIPGWSVANLQGRGKGTLANEMRCLYAFEELGYDAIVCTVDAANEAQKRVLTKNEWQKPSSSNLERPDIQSNFGIRFSAHD